MKNKNKFKLNFKQDESNLCYIQNRTECGFGLQQQGGEPNVNKCESETILSE